MLFFASAIEPVHSIFRRPNATLVQRCYTERPSLTMNTNLEWLSLLFIAASLQGFFIAFVLVRKRANRKANRLLSILIGLISMCILSQAFEINSLLNRILIRFPHLYGTIDPFIWLIGPVYYLYTRTLLDRKFSFSWASAVHVVPSLFVLLSHATFYKISGYEKNLLIKQAALHQSSLNIEPFLFLLHLLLYFLAAYAIVFRYSQDKPTAKRIDHFNWLKGIHACNLGLIVLLVLSITIHALDLNPLVQLDYLIAFGSCCTIYGLGYFGMLQKEIPADKYKRSGLDPTQKYLLKQSLLRMLEREKIFIDNTLTQKELAGQLGISAQHLSQLLNESFQENFYSLINRHRIVESQRLMQDPAYSHYSILAIAEEVGFNSKSVFNRVFKQRTGLTPSAFRKQLSK